jgi:hypothetical protein
MKKISINNDELLGTTWEHTKKKKGRKKKKKKKKEEREILLSVEPCLFSKGHYTNLIKKLKIFFLTI